MLKKITQRLRALPLWFVRGIPLGAAALTLLLGLLPLARVPALEVAVSVYRLPPLHLLSFLVYPLLLALVWLLPILLPGFEKPAKFLLAGASAVQVPALFFLERIAGQEAQAMLVDLGANRDAVAPTLGAGFFLLLALAVLLLIGSALQIFGFGRSRRVAESGSLAAAPDFFAASLEPKAGPLPPDAVLEGFHS
ncbi:MAG: hypothetical protein LBQ33_01040 [Oscillospiraceae bacterium]|jgi:hypothetical protein|nr:hypothetical protein [Oscillospiraceae bacterium]